MSEVSGDLSSGARAGGGDVHNRRYRNPPVVEALCEISFTKSQWDDTIPGAFYERVKKDFPQKQQRKVQEAEITMGLGQAPVGLRAIPTWMQFVSEQKHRVLQLAPDLLVVNQLAPYPHFEEWAPDIYRAFKLYIELAKPELVQRVGVRYINRVVIPEHRLQMEKYFTIYPSLPKTIGDTHGSFLVRVEVPQEQDGHVILITFATAPPDGGTPGQAFVLDFYDLVHVNKPIDAEQLRQEVERAHKNIVRAFENSITDRLRHLFEELEEGE
jgi:uncharacterized protein (TIGR04255 family)